MPRASRRDEIAALLALRDREHLTYEELSARCGLAATTLSWWSWRLRRDADAQPAFAEVELRGRRDTPRTPPPRPHLLFRRGDWEVEIQDAADSEQVRAILELLVSLPC